MEQLGDRMQIFTDKPHGVFEGFLKEHQLQNVSIRHANIEDVFLKLTGQGAARRMTQPNIRKSPAKFSIPKLSYRVWKVWRRNVDVFIKTIKVNFFPSLLEPILYLVAFGFGLGGFIPSIHGQPYINFIAPALDCDCHNERFVFRMYFCLFCAYVLPENLRCYRRHARQCRRGSGWRIIVGCNAFHDKRIDCTRCDCCCRFLYICAFDYFATVPVGAAYRVLWWLNVCAIAMCFTAVAPNIDFFNYPSFLFITPMLFLCGTFFPLTSLPVLSLKGLALAVLPLTHLVNIIRGVVVGGVEPILGLSQLNCFCS